MIRTLLYKLVALLRTANRPCDRMCFENEYRRLSDLAAVRGCDLPFWPSVAEARDLELWLWGYRGTTAEMITWLRHRRQLRRCKVCGCTDDNGCTSKISHYDGARACHWVDQDLCSSCEIF